MSHFRVTGLEKGGWPVVVDYEAEQGAYVQITVVTQDAPQATVLAVLPQRIGQWQQVIGKELEMDFVADPGSSIAVTLSSRSFESGKDEIESLEIERLIPQRLATRPIHMERVAAAIDSDGPAARRGLFR